MILKASTLKYRRVPFVLPAREDNFFFFVVILKLQTAQAWIPGVSESLSRSAPTWRGCCWLRCGWCTLFSFSFSQHWGCQWHIASSFFVSACFLTRTCLQLPTIATGLSSWTSWVHLKHLLLECSSKAPHLEGGSGFTVKMHCGWPTRPILKPTKILGSWEKEGYKDWGSASRCLLQETIFRVNFT